MRRANTMISRALQADPHGVYVDTDWVMLDADGKPRADLLKEDGLHLNEDGYVLWSALVRPHLR
jgi:lysophospholipase L1-like esterase